MDVPLRLLDLRCLVFTPTQHTVTLHASDYMSSATPNCKEPAGNYLHTVRACAQALSRPIGVAGFLRLRNLGRGS